MPCAWRGLDVRFYGPLAGLEGVVIRRTEEAKLVVRATLRGQGVWTPLDDCEVERID